MSRLTSQGTAEATTSPMSQVAVSARLADRWAEREDHFLNTHVVKHIGLCHAERKMGADSIPGSNRLRLAVYRHFIARHMLDFCQRENCQVANPAHRNWMVYPIKLYIDWYELALLH
jgi:hypothetical protein